MLRNSGALSVEKSEALPLLKLDLMPWQALSMPAEVDPPGNGIEHSSCRQPSKRCRCPRRTQ